MMMTQTARRRVHRRRCAPPKLKIFVSEPEPPPPPPYACVYVHPRDALEGGEVPPPSLQGAEPMPSHCPPDAKCRPQRRL